MHKHDPNNPNGEMSPEDVSREIHAYVDMLLEDLAELEQTGIDPRRPSPNEPEEQHPNKEN